MLRLSPKGQQPKRGASDDVASIDKHCRNDAGGSSPKKQPRPPGGLIQPWTSGSRQRWTGARRSACSPTRRPDGSPRRFGNTPPPARPHPSQVASRCSSPWCWPTCAREAQHRERISALRSEAGRRGGRPARTAKQATAFHPKLPKASKASQNPESRTKDPRGKKPRFQRKRRGARRAAQPPPRRSSPSRSTTDRNGLSAPNSPASGASSIPPWTWTRRCAPCAAAARQPQPPQDRARHRALCRRLLAREQDRGGAGGAGAGYGAGGAGGYARGPKRVQEQMYEQRRYDPAEFDELSPEQLEWLEKGGDGDER